MENNKLNFYDYLSTLNVDLNKLKRYELAPYYIDYLSITFNMSKEETYHFVLSKQSNYDFKFENGEFVSANKILSNWSGYKGLFRYYYDEDLGRFFKQDYLFWTDNEVVSVDEINSLFGTSFQTDGKIAYEVVDDIELLREQALTDVDSFLPNYSYDDSGYTYYLPYEKGRDLMISFLSSVPNLEKDIWTDALGNTHTNPVDKNRLEQLGSYELVELYNKYFGVRNPIDYNGGIEFELKSEYFEKAILGEDFLYSYQKSFADYFASKYTSLLGLNTTALGINESKNIDEVCLSFENYTDYDVDFTNQNFTLSYNGFDLSYNYGSLIQQGYDPVEVISTYLMSNNAHSYDDLGLVLSLRSDTSNDALKLLFSGNVSDIEFDGKEYKVIFNNGQVATFDENDYNGFISAVDTNNSDLSLEELIGYSEANVSCETSRILSEYFGGSIVDVRVVSPEKCMVLINGVEYEYSTNEILKIMETYKHQDVSQIKLQKISSYLNLSGEDGKKYELVLNPVNNQYILKCIGEDVSYKDFDKSFVDMDKLLESDVVKSIIKENPDFDLNSLSLEQLLQLMVDDMGIANFDTANVPVVTDTSTNRSCANKYMSKKIFKPIIDTDTDVYLNFAMYLNSVDIESIKSKISNIYSSYFSSFTNGSFVNSVTSNFSEIDDNIKTLAKQINYSVSLLMNYDVSLKDELNKLIDEFFEVSSVSYEGTNKIDLVNEKNDEVSEFFKAKKEEFYRQANEISLALTGYVVLTEDQRKVLEAGGYTVSSFSARDITGDENASDVKNYYCISIDDCDKILGKHYGVTEGESYIDNIYTKLEKDGVFDSKTGTIDGEKVSKLDSIGILSMQYFNYSATYCNPDIAEEMVNKQRASYAYANLSPYYDTLFSEDYIDILNDKRLNFDKYMGTKEYPYAPGVFPYKYDDSLTLGANALFYTLFNSDLNKVEEMAESFDNNIESGVYADPEKRDQIYTFLKSLSKKYDLNIPSFDENLSVDEQINIISQSFNTVCKNYSKMYDFSWENYLDVHEKLKSPKASESLLSYNYVKMKGYEKAVKYLEGVYEDGEIDDEDWLTYVGKCFGEGFVTTFSGFADMVNPEYDSNDYMKSFLAEMMVSSDMDMENNQKRYQSGEISFAEYNLKKTIIDAYESGDMRLESLTNLGKGANVVGQIGFEVLLAVITMGVGSHISVGCKSATAATRVMSGAKMLKDAVMVFRGVGGNKKNYIHSKYGDLYYAIADFEADRLNRNANITAWGTAGLQFAIRNVSNIYGLRMGGDLSKSNHTFLKKLGKVDKGNYNQMTGGELKGKPWKYNVLFQTKHGEAGLRTTVPSSTVSSGWVKSSFGAHTAALGRSIINNEITGFGLRGSNIYIPIYNLMGTHVFGDLETEDQKDVFSLSWDKSLLYLLRGVTGFDAGVTTD